MNFIREKKRKKRSFSKNCITLSIQFFFCILFFFKRFPPFSHFYFCHFFVVFFCEGSKVTRP